MSLEHPVVSLSPGTSRDVVLPAIRRLAPLRHHIRAMIVAGALGADRLRSLIEDELGA